jgi:macrolide transport system ATP-binding/permease protein
MSVLGRFFRKLAILPSRGRFRSELDEEMAFHRAETERELITRGVPVDTARSLAKRQFGNSPRIREQSQEVVGFPVEAVWQDLRFAVRQMSKNPGFALTAVSILALGMGASVAIFGLVDAALLEPLPYMNPNRLMAVDESSARHEYSNVSRDDYDDWKRLNHSFSSLEAYSGSGYLLATPSGAAPVPAARVSAGFFSTLGVKPMLGRGFLPGEDQPGRAKTVILTYGTWIKRFGGRHDVVGQSLTLSGDSYTIVGVLPREFVFAPRGNAQFYVPLLDKNGCEQNRSCHNLYGLGRLRDGVTIAAARAEMQSIAAQLEKRYPGSNKGQGAFVAPLTDIIVRDVRRILYTLLVGAGLVLLIACVNVASLVLVRSESRRREVAVRGAVGATRLRLVRQFATEGLLLAALACMAGLAIGAWLMTLMTRLVPEAMVDSAPFLGTVGLNIHTGYFAMGIVLMTAVLLACTPIARLSFQDIRMGLGEDSRTAAGRVWQRLGANLVVVELALAVVLLVAAGLLGQSFYRLLRVDNGFDTTHLATVQVIAPDTTYGKDAQRVGLYREIQRQLSSLPGVQSVGITSDLPVQCNCDTDWIRIVGKPFHGEHNEVNQRDVSPGYMATLKASLVRGRMLGDQDDASHPRVILINEALAARYFPGVDPMGKMIGSGDPSRESLRQVVGMIRNIREGALDEDIWPAEYFSIYQSPDGFFAVAVRSAQDERSMLPGIVKAIHKIDPNLGVYGEASMTDQIQSSESSLLHRFSTWLVASFASLALLLAVIGLYGVVAYSVSRRTREIGVRMALGAQRATVYRMVMGQAGSLAALGIGIGLVSAVGTSLLLRKILFGVEAWNAPTLAGVALLLATAALAASFLPARRAASVDPTEALRAE